MRLKNDAIVSFLLLVLATQGSAVEAERHWPNMQEFETKADINTASEKIFFQRILKDIQGQARYVLTCLGGSENYLDGLQNGMENVGPLACRLNDGIKDSEDTLLSEDDSPYWHSRGQIFDFRELTGACARYPEYGAVRHFRLRGFELTLRFENVKADRSGMPERLEMVVSLKQDALAHTAQAEQTGYLTPYKVGYNCRTIRRGNEPRMCRDWKNGGGWTECTRLNR